MNKTCVLVACMCLVAVAAVRGQTMAVVDMEELVRLHPDTVSDKKLFDQTLKDFRGENDELRQKLEALQEDFEKIRKESQDASLSEKARKSAEDRAAKSRDALIAADRNAREKMQSRQEQLSDMQTRMLKKTVSEIRDVIKKYAAERKLQVVMAANQVVYSDKTLDITDAILKQMNITPASKDMDAVPLLRETVAPAVMHTGSTNAPVLPK